MNTPPNERSMNPREFGAALMHSVAVHFMIRQMDELKETSLYRHKLKLAGNAYLKELERHARETMWVEREDTRRSA